MDKGSLSRAPALSRTVRIHAPSEVTYDLERMQKVTASSVGQAGMRRVATRVICWS